MLNAIFSSSITGPATKFLLSLTLIITMSLLIPKLAQAQSKTSTDNNEKLNRVLIEKHLLLWNEQDKAKRTKILNEIYAPDVEMVDRHFIAKGRRQVDGFIADLHKKNPDFRFSHVKPVDTHHHIARMYWQVGNAANPAAVTGMDFFVIENGRVKKLYVFVDEAK